MHTFDLKTYRSASNSLYAHIIDIDAKAQTLGASTVIPQTDKSWIIVNVVFPMATDAAAREMMTFSVVPSYANHTCTITQLNGSDSSTLPMLGWLYNSTDGVFEIYLRGRVTNVGVEGGARVAIWTENPSCLKTYDNAEFTESPTLTYAVLSRALPSNVYTSYVANIGAANTARVITFDDANAMYFMVMNDTVNSGKIALIIGCAKSGVLVLGDTDIVTVSADTAAYTVSITPISASRSLFIVSSHGFTV